MKKLLFKKIITASFLMIAITLVSFGIVQNSNVKNTTSFESNNIDYDYVSNTEEYTEISLDASAVLPQPTTPQVGTRSKSIKNLEFYSGSTKLDISKEIRIGMGRFNDKNFSYKVVYSDDTKSESKDITTRNLKSFIGTEYAERFIYDTGRYKVNIALNGNQNAVILNLYMSEEEADDPLRLTIKYYDSSDQVLDQYGPGASSDEKVMRGTFGRKVPHLVNPNPVTDPSDVVVGPFRYSFKEWDYNDPNTKNRIVSSLDIKGVYNVGHSSRCVNLFNHDSPTATNGTYQIVNTVAKHPDDYIRVYFHIGMMEGVRIWQSASTNHTQGTQEVVSVNFDSSHVYASTSEDDIKNQLSKELFDYCGNGIEFDSDDARKDNFKPAYTTTSTNLVIDTIANLKPVIIVDTEFNQKYSVTKPEDEFGHDFLSLRSTGYTNDISINADLASGEYNVSLYYNFDVYIGFDYKLNGDDTFDYKNVNYTFYQYGKYFALTQSNMVEEFENDANLKLHKTNIDVLLALAKAQYESM